MLQSILRPPLVTADLPGIGGRIKVQPEDFEVEEVPAYEPSGQGDFLYLWVEKTDVGAEYFIREAARRLGIPLGEVGSAGLKDRRAVTRQWISVPAEAEPRLAQLDGGGIRVLRTSKHSNKLRSGHLHGNRFRILVRDLHPEAASETNLAALLGRLRGHGLLNYYGPQRFGIDTETLRLGMQLLYAEAKATPPESLAPLWASADSRRVRNPFLKKLALSAMQSALFNAYLGQRFLDGLSRRVLPGDVMAKIPFGGMFTAEDVATEQARLDAGEIVPAGPIFGRKTFPAKSEAADREQAVLGLFNLSLDSFRGFGKLLQGTRRHNLVVPPDLIVAREPDGLRLSFTLPAGSYATVLLREIMKTETTDEDTDRSP